MSSNLSEIAAQRSARVEAAAVRIRPELLPGTDLAIVAGSGLSGLGDRLSAARRIDYGDIPGWPRSTVEGHAGQLVLGQLAGRSLIVAAGRAHLYEGYDAFDASFNMRVFLALGIRTLVITNAAGGLNPDYAPGDLMLIADHINLPGMAGNNPLVGPNDDARGPRFPGIAGAYDLEMQARARAAGRQLGFRVHSGVYAMVSGPSFETPAEGRFLLALGADVVGMSTAPEVLVARHGGMRVLGISLVTNRVLLEQPGADEAPTDLHAEVTEAGAKAAERLAELIEVVVSPNRDY